MFTLVYYDSFYEAFHIFIPGNDKCLSFLSTLNYTGLFDLIQMPVIFVITIMIIILLLLLLLTSRNVYLKRKVFNINFIFFDPED